ncbi:MAG TPA: hypothetical protein DEQ38_06150 [Elusimicrobia bacterium]|nr:MAG: hypothetical protein A2089_00055 [Elusimicrobia bacterium GWD2_63_28]HCC47684.1 hypothetical protein [Elusimicrobiota bacterium]
MPELAKPLPPEDKLVLLPKNPGSFFVFWQFSAGRAEAFQAAAFAPEIELRLSYCDDKTHAAAHKAQWQAGRAYVPVPERGGNCEAALYALRNGAWEKLLESNQAAAPVRAGAEADRAYASMEFHKRVQP